jgi:predicted metal-dependent phosphotriesterase family hydrolase
MAALRRIATESGVHIVASGGFYTQTAYPPEIAGMSEDQIADELVKQAKADHLGAFGEIGSSATMTPDEHKVFRGVGKAHLRTGLPIFTHNAFAGERFKVSPNNPLEQVDIFEGLGVNLQHVVIGHLCCQSDLELPKAVAKRGVFVGIDRIGFESMEPDALRVKMVTALIDAGYLRNIMLSSDFYQENLLKSKGGPGIGFVATQFYPKLREAGVTAEALHTISVENPRRWLSFVPKKA